MEALSSDSIYDQLPHYGDTILDCSVYISRSIHDAENQRVLHYVCALLNSGGGILQMRNVDHDHQVQSKDLDMWWSGIENRLADILSGDDLCNYFDFIGNFDDRYFFLFVKTAEHLCTVNYHCRLPSDTATHCVTFTSAVKLLSKTGEPASLVELPAVPKEFVYGHIEETLKQEGKQIQFKLLTNDSPRIKAFSEKISSYCSKYITAFANHYGGHVYFGIEDATAAVFGENIRPKDEVIIVQQMEKKMNGVLWGDADFKAVRGKHWDIQFHPVSGCPNTEKRSVVVVSICKFPGGVFTSCPESFVVRPKRKIRQLTFAEWKKEVLNQIRVKPELLNRFVKLSLHTPFSSLVFALPHTLQDAKEKILKLSTGFSLQPPLYMDTVKDAHLRDSIRHVLSTFACETHLAVALHCFGTHLSSPMPEDMCTSIFVLSKNYGALLICFITSHANDARVMRRAQTMAIEFKEKLIQRGGCVDRLGIKVHLLSLADPFLLQNFQVTIDAPSHPSTYSLTEEKMDHIRTALLISMASYETVTDNACFDSYYFLLTCGQLELLWTRQFTKELWVHGPPGSGKTMAIVEMIRELVNRGCQSSQILYIAEGPLLCTYVSNFNLCTVISRRELMQDSTILELFNKKYSCVRNVFIDDAQNFKDRDGDWYSLASSLANQGEDNSTLKKCDENCAASQDTSSAHKGSSSMDLTNGFFWVCLDYAQKVHKFKAGLPGVIGKNNFMLSEITRNSKEIFKYAAKFLNKTSEGLTEGQDFLSDNPILGHDYESGHSVEVVKCRKDAVQNTLCHVLDSYLGNGAQPGDIAILVSKNKDREFVEKDLHENASHGKIDVMVDTVRQFSGLDKPIIIGLDPYANVNHADMDKFIANLVTRAKDGLVIITSSDELMKKLQDQ